MPSLLEAHRDTAEELALTWTRPVHRPRSINNQACLVHIYPSGPHMGHRQLLGDFPLMLGRSTECNLCINDASVSRKHALLDPHCDGYQVIDQGSTNGTFINDRPTMRAILRDGDYLRIGNAIFRFLADGNVESDYHEEIYRLTILDALTSVHNKRYLMEYLEREVGRARRHQRPLALILLDVDEFKKINDELGHLTGDFFLRELAGRISNSVNPEDLFARYGGEEFALVLVETQLDEAVVLAEKLRQQVAAQPFLHRDGGRSVTISLGVAAYDGREPLSAADLLCQADEKLYQAKRAGRNQVVA